MQQLCLNHDKKAVNLPVSKHLNSPVAVTLPVHVMSLMCGLVWDGTSNHCDREWVSSSNLQILYLRQIPQ